LVTKAEQWRWSSVWRREKGSPQQKKLLSAWPVPQPDDYISWLNKSQTVAEEEDIQRSIVKSSPFGSDDWIARTVKRFGLEQTVHAVGRRKKNGG